MLDSYCTNLYYIQFTWDTYHSIYYISSAAKGKAGDGSISEIVVIREVGGVMAPIWKSYIEPGKTNAILYVVDTSSPETLGASTIHLIDLLSHSSIANITPVLIVFRLVNIYVQCIKLVLINNVRIINQNLYFTFLAKQI